MYKTKINASLTFAKSSAKPPLFVDGDIVHIGICFFAGVGPTTLGRVYAFGAALTVFHKYVIDACTVKINKY